VTVWVLIAVVVVAAAALWLQRGGGSSAAPRWHDAARSEALRGALSGQAPDATIAPQAPPSMPDFRLPLARTWRSAAGAAGEAEGARWLLYDTEVRRASVAGCNSERISGGDTPTVIARHTVAVLQSDRLALPHFTLVPNVGGQLAQAIPDRFREAGLGGSKMAAWASKAGGALSRLEEHGTAVGFPGAAEFADAFRVVGEDEPAARELFDEETMALTLRSPWAIVEGQGGWLAVSRNTAAAYRTRHESPSDGLLSVESAAELVALAAALAARWSRRPSTRAE
jgi:hypothetical protein